MLADLEKNSGNLIADHNFKKTSDYMPEGLFVANCVDFMRDMPEGCVDLVVTSPPYDNLRDYNGYEFCFSAIADGLYKVILIN
jgi:site-specific DNA-methyltransferase (adenine-specific)